MKAASCWHISPVDAAVRLDFELSGQGNPRFSVYRTLQLGLDDVQVEVTTRLRAKDGALVVEQQVASEVDVIDDHCGDAY